MPKRRRVPPVIRPGSRKPTARWDEERRSQLLVIALGAAVVIAVALIAIFGYYQTQVRPKGETVLQVGNRSFSLDYVERRLRYDIRQGNTIYQSNPSQAATLLLNEIEQEELMRQGAPEKGVDLSDEAIDAEIRSRENVPDNADQQHVRHRLPKGDPLQRPLHGGLPGRHRRRYGEHGYPSHVQGASSQDSRPGSLSRDRPHHGG